MTEFVIGNLRVPYALKRSERANRVHIEMTMDAMRVTVPTDASNEAINGALYTKRRWIVENHYALAEKYAQTHKVASLRTGAKIPYWGRMAALQTEAADVELAEVRHRNNGILIRHRAQPTAEQHDALIETALRDWLRDRLRSEARQAIRRYAAALDVQTTSVRVGELTMRWGSCGEKGAVSLDWHLVFAPKRVVHYVIAHELAHLIERNHSTQFWLVVRKAFGEYQAEHDWLTKNEHLLGYQRIPIDMPQKRATAHCSASATRP
jgi:predicted metal-dependent hydrolase